MPIHVKIIGPEVQGVPTPREALDFYRKAIPERVAKQMPLLFKQLTADERFELLFYMSAGLSETVYDILDAVRCPHCDGNDEHEVN